MAPTRGGAAKREREKWGLYREKKTMEKERLQFMQDIHFYVFFFFVQNEIRAEKRMLYISLKIYLYLVSEKEITVNWDQVNKCL
jgi:hypothetical protein